MSDISLLWYRISNDHVTASRAQVRELIADLDMHGHVLARDSKLVAFRAACAIRLPYTDAEGRDWTVHAVETKRSTEFVTASVTREDGYRLAEFKFFQSRRTRAGVVKGTHLLRTTVRRPLPAQDKAATLAWIEAATAVYEQTQGEAPWTAIRRQARLSVLTAAIPVIGRDSMFFLYDDEIEVAHQTRAFIDATCTGYEFVLLAVDDSADYSVFAASADHQLAVEELEPWAIRVRAELELGMRPLSANRHAKLAAKVADVRRLMERHERRLSLQLPRTRSSLAETEEMISRLPHPSSLHRVNEQ